MSVDLYKYFPTFIKIRDRLASGIDDADSRETILAKLVYMLDEMFDDTDAFIQELIKLNDPDVVDQQYFSHVSYLLGTMLPNGSNEEESRFIIKQLVNHYKTSGTHHSWHTAWHWLDQPETKVVELFKRDQQEIANYSTVRSANHPLKSARIQLGVCASTCETVCESVCETTCEGIVETGSELPVAEALRRLAYVEYLRPIHVILRQNAEEVLLRSGFPTSQDTIGHYPRQYNVVPDPWLGSESYGSFQSEFWTAADELEVDVQCVALCEVTCQTCCEAVCECNPCEVVCQVGDCQLQCTEGCQGACEFPCEAVCQFACTACQAGACTASCAGACLGSCQGSCAASCQAYCTDDQCQAGCTTCQAGTCTSSCAGACLGSCQGACAASCEAYCTDDSCQAYNCQAASCQEGYCMIATQAEPA